MKYSDIAICVIVFFIFLFFGFVFFLNNVIITEKENRQLIVKQKYELSLLNTAMSKLSNFYKEIQNSIYPNPIHKDDYTKLTSPLGIRKNPLKEAMGGSDETDHKGVDETGRQTIKEDIEGLWMARVISVAAGKVDLHYLPEGWHNGKYYSGYNDCDGYVIVKHFDGKESRYLHLGETYVHEGQIIPAGYVIGRISEKTDGKSTGPHLHFELLDENGNYLQPLKYIEH